MRRKEKGMLTETYLSGDPTFHLPLAARPHSVHQGTERDRIEEADLGSVWLDMKTLSEYLHVSRSTLYKMVHEGTLPVVRVGRQLRIRRDMVDEMLSAGEFDL